MKNALILVFIAMLLFLGCTQNTQNQTTIESDQMVDSTQDATQATNQDEEKEPQANPLDQLISILSRQGTVQYKVTYEVDTGRDTTRMTMYIKGTGETAKMRVDTQLNENLIKAYTLERFTYLCTSDEGTYSCLKMTATDKDDISSAVDVGFSKDDLRKKNPTVTPDGVYTVSGTVAPCFRIENENEPVQKVCITTEGAMVLYQSNGETIMRATEYSTIVADNDFELPKGAQIIDFETMYR